DEDEDDDLSDIPPSSPRLSPTPLLGGTMSSAIHTHASLTTSPTSPSSPASGQTSAASPLSRVAGNCPGGSGSDTPQNISGFSSRGSPMGSPQHQMLASTSKTQRDFLSSAHFSSRLDCLSLTLEEVVHIRNVLTKADLDALPLDLSIKEDVEKGKICFLCMKTRFGFFAPRGRECRLCKRIVCKKCVTKMRIPTERFSNIPVIMLTPQALSPKDDDDEYSHASLPRTFLNMLQDIPKGTIERRPSLSASVGSAPSSPASLRSSQGPASLHSQSPAPCVNQDIQK
ncbi:Protein spire, partial [Armadillidium vulgare]